VRALLLVLALAGCGAISTAEQAKIEQGDAFVMDLTNAACSIGDATAAAPVVMLVCDVLDATGALVAHYVGPVPAAAAQAIVKRHPVKIVSPPAAAVTP
jgi:hypothetical protein